MEKNEVKRIAAIILAAGFSERMVDFKPLLKIGSKTALQKCLDLFASAAIEDILVISGHNKDLLSKIITSSKAVQVFNHQYKQGMFSSIASGIRAIEAPCDAFFILPVDIPLVRKATVQQLLNQFIKFRPAVCYPVFDNHRGHPPLIAATLIPEILNWQGRGGLAGFLRQMEHLSLDVQVADQAVLLDMDTPSDYHALQKRMERYDIPTKKECQALLQNVCRVEVKIQAHCKMVARVARGLAEALLQTGLFIDLDLLEAAAIVHDLARGQQNHGQAGAQLLNQWGFGALAPLVAAHMDLNVLPKDPLNETQLLYLADKLVAEDRIVDLDLRFQSKLDQYGHNQKAIHRICARWETANTIRTRIESALGLPLEQILIPVFQ